MKLSTKLGGGFGSQFLLLLGLGLISLAMQTELASNTTQLYRHPFVVSNATQEIQTQVALMQIGMNRWVQARNAPEATEAQALVQQAEVQIQSRFVLLKERFLGDPAQVNQAE